MPLGIKIPKNALAAGREAFKTGGDGFNNVTLEPGKYICQIQKGRATDINGVPNIIFDLKVAGESENAGKNIAIFFKVTEEHSVWLFRLFTLLGYDVSEMDETILEGVLADIETNKPVVRVKATRKDDYTNYRIEKLITDVNFADTENAADTEAAGGTAGIAETAPPAVQAKATPPPAEKAPTAVKPPKAMPVAAAPPAPNPAEPETAEEAVTEAEEVVEEETVPLTVGMEVPALIGGKKVPFVVTAIHEAENKVTGRSKTDNKLYKVGLEKLG